MAKSVNSTFPVQIMITVTDVTATELRRIAAERGTTVRALGREYLAAGMERHGWLTTVDNSIRTGMAEVAERTGRTVPELVSRYCLAGSTHDLLQLGAITPNPTKD